jgi:hypothetical protein
MHGLEVSKEQMKWHYKATKWHTRLNNSIQVSQNNTSKRLWKDAPGDIHILPEGTTQNEVPLLALVYIFRRKTVVHFVLTKNAGSQSQECHAK